MHEKVNLCENKFGRLVPRANAGLRSGGRSEHWFPLSFNAVDDVDNIFTIKKKLNGKTPAQVFWAAADPPSGVPPYPLTMFGAPCAYVNHPEYQESKYDDHAKPGWAAGVSRRNGPLDYSMAAVITESNNEIAVDFGMLKIVNANPACTLPGTGYIINPKYLGFNTLIPMGATRLENQGGGERCYIDVAGTLVVKHPQAHGKIAYSA